MTITKTLTAMAVATIFISAPAAFAADEHNVSVGVTAAGAPLGLHGVDPVAIIRDGAMAEGDAAQTVVHDGVAYYFSSAETMAAFEADPEAFLPQYGGFCTFGVSVGKKFDGDPTYAAVIDGALYVFSMPRSSRRSRRIGKGRWPRPPRNGRRSSRSPSQTCN
ncbi:MAG: YHS domain-containing (seleno)protein [Pseudomonadota bacterium]